MTQEQLIKALYQRIIIEGVDPRDLSKLDLIQHYYISQFSVEEEFPLEITKENGRFKLKYEVYL